MAIVEVNAGFMRAKDSFRAAKKGGNRTVFITPPLDENYWVYRIRLRHDQAIVVFPKFGMLGCGFAIEDDWNTNLPLACDAEEIYNHIKHNKKYADIPDAECVAAIKELQQFVTSDQSPVTDHGTRSTLRNSGQADHE